MAKIQHRSNLVSVINEVESINITEAHHLYLQQTPFWKLISSILSVQLKKDNCRKSDIDVDTIIKTFDKCSKSFNLGGIHLSITQEEVQQMFGIEDGEEFIDLAKKSKNPNTEFVARRFEGLPRIKKQHISEALRSAAGEDTDVGRQDVARLLTLFCLATLFVPNKGLSFSWLYVYLVEDMGLMKQYNWSAHILEFLENSLCSASRNTGVAGCIMMLPYWICEHTTLVPKAQKTGTPRCVVWDLRPLWLELKTTNLKKLNQHQVLRHDAIDYEEEYIDEQQKDDGDGDGDDDDDDDNDDDEMKEKVGAEAPEMSGDEMTVSDILKNMKSNVVCSGTVQPDLGDSTGTVQPEMTGDEMTARTDTVTEPEPVTVPIFDKGVTHTDPVPSVVQSLNSDRIQELEDEIKKKDEKIAEMKKQIEDKDEQLTQLYIENENMTLENSRLKQELGNVNAVVELMRAEAEEAITHEITQQEKASSKKKKQQHTTATDPPSMYKRLKEKPRQRKRDPEYTYDGKKKSAKNQKTATPAVDPSDKDQEIIDIDQLEQLPKGQERSKKTSVKHIIASFRQNTQLTAQEKERIINLIHTDGIA